MTPTTRGPLPPAVYWRRRAFVLGTVLAVVVFLVAMVRSGGDDTPPQAQQSSATTTDTTSDTATETPTDDPTSSTDGDKSDKKTKKNKNKKKADDGVDPVPEEPELAVPVGSCDDDDVLVNPVVQLANAGSPVTIDLRLRTREADACTWTVSSQHLALKISDSDGQTVWNSVECPGQVRDASVVVRREATSTLSVGWNARYSSAGCPAPRRSRYAEPGAYLVAAAALGSDPGESTFELGDVLPQIVEDEPTDDATPQGEKTTDQQDQQDQQQDQQDR